MSEEVEFQDVEIIEECDEEACQDGKKSSAGESVSKAINSFMETLESALSGRGNSVMVRVNDEALAKLDMLIAAGICKSRSESAAFLINEGIKSNKALFDKIRNITDQISALRAQLRESVEVGE